MTQFDPRNEDRLRGIEARLAEIERRLGIGGGAAQQAYGTPAYGSAPTQYGAPGGSAAAFGGTLGRGASVDNDAEIQNMIMRGKKIEAIKRARELTGWGLKDAKDYVDQLAARMGYR